MKKFTFLAITAILLLNYGNLFAQQQNPQNSSTNPEKCGTQQWLNAMFNTYPAFQQQYLSNERKLGEAVSRYLQQQSNTNTNRTTTTYYIPIVFHVVLSNQSLVPDAMIIAQLNRLNEDFSGLNPDSTNAPLFYSVRGHSKIQFCLAQRTPNNTASNGIVRIVSGTTSVTSPGDPIKYTSLGGDDAWDASRFVNVWVGMPTNSSILGYATFPIGSPENNGGGYAASDQGVFINAGTLPGGSITSYNLGRTLSHEMGHFVWLRHIWGDDVCGDDFPNTPGIDDTPQQSDETFGCPSGTVASGCTGFPNPPGRMYQNFMDYSNDACLTMFTNGQNIRTDQALFTFRPSLLSSNGCQPVTPVPNDASISAIVTPANNSGCLGATSPLTVTLRNAGSNTLTSVTITVQVNSAVVQTFNWTGSLASLASVNVDLNPVNLVVGTNTIDVCSSLPNGAADAVTSNDCNASTVYRSASVWPSGTIPLVEGFESATFPPLNWTRLNPDASITWQRTTTGAGHTGTGKAFVDHYNYVSFFGGEEDDLISPNLNIGPADSLYVDFWAAYRGYPGFPSESLQLVVSTNCGGSFDVVKTFNNLTDFAGGQTSGVAYYPASSGDYVKASVDLTNYISSGSVIVGFKSINQWGNNIHLDDININKVIFKFYDAGVIAINKPQSRECTNSVTPEVVIKNYGKTTLTSVKINYTIDGGPVVTFNWTGILPRNGSIAVTLPVANIGALGNHSITAYTTLPDGIPDEDPTNDALTKAYTIFPVIPLNGNVVEGFNSNIFPPANWTITNPNADFTWEWTNAYGKNAPGVAWFNDYNNPTNNRIDDLNMPNYSYSNIDSIFLKFNLSAVTYSYPGTTGILIDTLTVLLSKDCGNTFTSIYSKWGEDLQTVNDPNFPRGEEFFPSENYQWRQDSINLGKWLSSTESKFQLSYRFSGNFENNLFLDDINLRTQVLPTKLKNEGYLVLPNPFSNAFAVWHYQTPTNLRYINVFSSSGQLVWSKQYNGNAQRYIQIDLSKNTAGVYSVMLGYDDSNRNITVPVIKLK